MKKSKVSKEENMLNYFFKEAEQFQKLEDGVSKSLAEVSKFKSGKGKVYGFTVSDKIKPNN